MSPKTRGALIVVEGLDRAGKSTQCELLCHYLHAQGYKAKQLRFPDRTTAIGEAINAYLKGEAHQEDHAIHLLFSANRWEAAPSIRANIEAGFIIVVDRYYYSGIVYSVAKGNAHLTLQWAREPEVGLPRPDVCLFLDIAPEIAAQRGGFGAEKYETTTMQQRVRDIFNQLMTRPEGEDIVRIDANRSLSQIQQDMQSITLETLQDPKLGLPLRQILPWLDEEKCC